MTEIVQASVTKDMVRSAILGAKIKSKAVTLESGYVVEIRQPSVKDQLDLTQIEKTDLRMLKLFTQHIFMPGGTEPIFDVSDYEALKQVPASGDYRKIMEAINELMDLAVATQEATKN
jgi:hypothetical protein